MSACGTSGCTRALRECRPCSRRARPCRGLGCRQAPIPVACDEAAGADAVGLRRSEPYHRHRHDLGVEQDGRSRFAWREETGRLGRSARVVLIARMRCQPSGSASKNLIRASSLCPAAVDMLTPAQLIRMSSAPKVSSTCWTARRHSAVLETSVTVRKNFPAKTRSAARRLRPTASTSTPTILAPAPASARHHASHAACGSGHDGHAVRKQLAFCHDACLPWGP